MLNLINTDKIKIIPNGLYIEFNSINKLKKSLNINKLLQWEDFMRRKT